MSAEAVVTRWTTFLDKVSARLADVQAEADEGLTAIVDDEVLDSGPLSHALSELKARLEALRKKVDDAWETTIEPELERAGADEALQRTQRRRGRALGAAVEAMYEHLEVTHQARAARRLKALADAEGTERPCAKCGAPLTPEAWVRPTNVSCAHCGALNTVRPGTATVMFLQGGGREALAREATVAEATALREAARAFEQRAPPTEQDAATYRRALEAYWRPWCAARGRWTPGWSDARLDEETQVKVSQAWHWVEPERAAWKRRSTVLALALAGDTAGVRDFLATTGRSHRMSLDELLELAVEQRAAAAVTLLATLAWEDEGAAAPRDAWVAEKRREVEQTIARRRG